MHPILFQLHLLGREVPFYSFGFVLGWAVFLAAQTSVYFAERDGITRRQMWKFAAGVVVCGYFGSHLHSILTDETRNAGLSDMARTTYTGFTFYGAALAGTIAALPVSRALGIPFWAVVDAGAPSLALAHGIGRFGCFLWGCDYGVVARGALAPIGVAFPKDSPAWKDQVSAGVLSPAAERSLPVVPTQLIEMVLELCLAAALARFLYRRPRRQGTAILVYYLVYGIIRSILEQLRGDPGRGTLLGVSTSTAIGLLTASAALVLAAVPPLAALRPLRGPLPEPAPTAAPAAPQPGVA